MRSGGIFDYEGRSERLAEVLGELEDPTVWSKPERAQELGRERTRLEAVVGTLDRLRVGLTEAGELLELAEAEADEGMVRAVQQDVTRIEGEIARLEFQRMFPGEMDPHNCFLDIQAGAGGTEAQDWAQMLMRMYLRWADKHGFKSEVTDQSDGEVAGIKSCSLRVEGEYAYGWLRTETGVHRLVRKSPFDSNARRHTSFASVFVSPEVDDDINIEVNPADLEMDVYRSSGAGGQHVNKTESAVRIRHLPSGIVVACQSERSQHKNRSTAMKMLKSKLYELEVNKRNAARQGARGLEVRRELGQPDPFLRARPVAHQGPPHRRRDRQHGRSARRGPRPVPRSKPEAGAAMTEERSEVEVNHLIAERRAKLERLRETGNAFPNDFRRDSTSEELHVGYDAHPPEWFEANPTVVTIAGRMMFKRVMGKASFAKLKDRTGLMQVFLQQEALGETYEDFKGWDVGDVLGAEGSLFKTRTGELSVRVERLRLLVKSLRPLPDKWHGLADVEQRYRQRYLDLIVNDDSRQVFRARTRIVQFLRSFLERARLHGGRDADDAGDPGRCRGAALRDPPQRARRRHVPAHRAGALSQAPGGRRFRAGLRDRTATSATRGCPRSTTPSSRCSSSTRPTPTTTT